VADRIGNPHYWPGKGKELKWIKASHKEVDRTMKRLFARWAKKELSVEDQEDLIRKVCETFSGELVKELPAWELTIALESGKQVTAELSERDAKLLGEWLGIKLLGNVLVKGPFTFVRSRSKWDGNEGNRPHRG
jgi:hypothetical protein